MDFEEPKKVLQRKGYQTISLLGTGKLGTCYRVYSEKYKQDFVCKVIKKDQNSHLNEQSYKNEVEILKLLGHKNIVNIYNYFSESDMFFIYLDYFEIGSLDQIIPKNGPIEVPLHIRNTFKQILEGVSFCHHKNIAHRDIKPGNILVSKTGRIKLCDFGFSYNKATMPFPCKDFVGSLCFMAPEIIMMKPYDPFKADMWSIGITFYYLVTGCLPFEAKTPKEMLQNFYSGFQSLPSSLPEDIKDVILKCIQFNPLKRPTCEELIEIIKNGGKIKNLSSQQVIRSNLIIQPKVNGGKSNFTQLKRKISGIEAARPRNADYH